MISIPNEPKFGKIDRLWAENGVIRFQLEDGTTSTVTVKEAAKRIMSINNMPIPEDMVEQRTLRQEFVEKAIKVVREAKKQLENPDDKTKALHTVLSGKDETGKAVSLPKKGEEYLINQYVAQFFTLTEQEIVTVLREEAGNLTIQQKEFMMKTVHEHRLKGPNGTKVSLPGAH